MPDFENKPDFNDALNTLGANQGNASDQTISVNDPDFANKVAAQQQKMSQPQSVSQAQAQAQAYAETQHLGEPTQPRAASFNANGDPEAQEQNVVLGDTEQELPSDYLEDDDDYEQIYEENKELRDQVVDLQGKLNILKNTLASEHDQRLRAVAEADNVRKRASQEVERERKFALEKFVRALLPIYDALEKALEFSDRENEATKATIDGVENTLNLFLKELSGFGVELVDPAGQPFDPNFHQAVSMVPSTEVPNNHVLQTMQKGFLLNGRVVRPAMVIVAKQ